MLDKGLVITRERDKFESLQQILQGLGWQNELSWVEESPKEALHQSDDYKMLFIDDQYSEAMSLATDEGMSFVQMAFKSDGGITLQGLSSKEHSQVLAQTLKLMVENKELHRQLGEERKIVTDQMRMAALGEMASHIVHEISNPLAVISGKVSQLKVITTRKPIDMDKVSLGLGKIDDMVLRLVKIIRGVRLFARNVHNEQLGAFSVQEIVEEAIDLCEVKLRMSNVEFQGIFGDSAETVTCRYTEMVQVIMNLISNSCDAIYGLPERWLKIVVSSQADGVCIRVIDSGSGIPKDMQNKIFAHGFTTKSREQGLGIGLRISLRIVKDIGGDLFVDSSEKNTCFVVKLPKRILQIVK